MAIDPTRVICLPGVTLEDVEYLQQDLEERVVSDEERLTRALDFAALQGFKDVVVVGLHANGAVDFSSSIGDPERMLGLMQRGVVELGQDLRDCALLREG